MIGKQESHQPNEQIWVELAEMSPLTNVKVELKIWTLLINNYGLLAFVNLMCSDNYAVDLDE